MKRMSIREILLGAVAAYMNCDESCLKKYKIYELKQMAEKFTEEETN